ncbi:TPA: hypothetical protein DEP21_02420 [Patescibacteria group bacterium]|nr:hypothetical protein [Candidatus Gracilibacteria bacterium]
MGKNGPEHSKSETVEEGKEGLKKTPDTTKKIERSLGDDESKKYLNEISQVFENGFDNGIDGQKITVDNANGKIHFGEFEEGKRDTYIYIDKTKVPADRESSFYDRMNIKNVNGQKILSIYNDADRVN